MSNILNRFKNDESNQSEIDETLDKYLTFLIDGKYYAFNIVDVSEIIEMQNITPVPEFPSYAKGIINLRGLIIPVIDVRMRFCMMEADYNERTCIIILTLKNNPVGFIVDTVDEVLDIGDECITSVPKLSDMSMRRFIDRVGNTPKKIVMILNSQKMLNDNEMESLDIDL